MRILNKVALTKNVLLFIDKLKERSIDNADNYYKTR